LGLEAPQVAALLRFNTSPPARFMGQEAPGERITFSENVFYTLREGRIVTVWTVIYKAAVESEHRGENAASCSDRRD
ncbi:ester cyclase, partial [Pseudomonas syringae pv. tagetis]|uniref:ester cyclase n=1 Tax=Pseudomonas syringae group genomosp. 7 TaxID=251699 RepID=UPI00376F7D61